MSRIESSPLEERAVGRATPLHGFSATEVEEICAAGTVRNCHPGEILFRRHEVGDSMFVIEDGEVEMIFVDSKPAKVLGPGEIFGELAFLTGNHLRTGTARARGACRLQVLDQDAVDRLFATRPRLLLNLLRRTCEYLLASEERLIASLRRKNRELEQSLDYLRRTQEEVDHQELLANTDELTGLYNRRCLDHQLRRFMERARKTGSGLALILADLDRFKQINDTWGHAKGDAVLRKVASVLTKSVRASDLPCRFGGDELAVVLCDVDAAHAQERAEALRAQVAEMRPVLRGLPLTVSVSVGGTMYEPGESVERLFERADAQLYRAKRGGRNRVAWATPGDREVAADTEIVR